MKGGIAVINSPSMKNSELVDLEPVSEKRPLDNAVRPSSFLDDITIDYGPRELLGQYFLAAYAECLRLGVTISFEPISALVEINEKNRDTWPPLLSVFDYRFGQLNVDNSFCIVGRDRDGRIIYTRAARLYELGPDRPSANFLECTERLQHLYACPSDAPNKEEHWSASGEAADAMRSMTGRVTFSGAVWCHPDHRKSGLPAVIAPIGRSYAYAKWANDFSLTFMAKGVVAGGHAKRLGYSDTKVAWTVHARNASIGDLDIAVVWTDADDIINRVEQNLSLLTPQIDRRIGNG